MTVDYGFEILSILIDWYETSPAHVRGEQPARRRPMRLYDGGRTDFPAYNIEDHLIRKEINQAVLDLAGNGTVGYSWMRGQQNHIIAKIWLNYDAVGKAYDLIGRRPKRDVTDETLTRMNELLGRIQAEWARRWLEDTIAAILRKNSIGAALPAAPTERDDLLKAVSFLADNTEIETLERVFSMRCFGDSKHFERSVKPRLARILRKYLAQENCTDDYALKLAGIVQYPERFEFSGALSITFPHGTIDFAALPSGGTLTIDDIKQGCIAFGQDVRRVLSIENRANYVDYVHKHQTSNEFVLFHGGQYSPAKRVFLQAVAEAIPKNCPFFHWGDIDYGGFLMLARLRREIMTGIRPWRMDQNELERYARFATSFSDAYEKLLASLLDVPELSDCYPCIEHMKKSRTRLEQEAMLT